MSENKKTPSMSKEKYMQILVWGIAVMLVLAVIGIAISWKGSPIVIDLTKATATITKAPATATIVQTNTASPIPATATPAITSTLTLTPIPMGPQNRTEPIHHIVKEGESIDSIAHYYGLAPETILWANEDLLEDIADYLMVDMELMIPPTDGIYYVWQSVDTLDVVASIFQTTPEEVIAWNPNGLSETNREPQRGQGVMFPNGSKYFNRFDLTDLSIAYMGDLRPTHGYGACEGNYEAVEGTGSFMQPVYSKEIAGNAFSSAHPGVDYYAEEDEMVRAVDAGVVIFSGWAYGGYGYTVMLDHGNGYQTIYAHLKETNVFCGDTVEQRTPIGITGTNEGSVKNAFHFEMLYEKEYVDPEELIP
jgi:hypothetical protein